MTDPIGRIKAALQPGQFDEYDGISVADTVLGILQDVTDHERAGVHTGGTLNREQAREVLEQYGLGYLDHEPAAAVLDALEACVVPDPRIPALESLCDAADATSRAAGQLVRISADSIRAILRGDA